MCDSFIISLVLLWFFYCPHLMIIFPSIFILLDAVAVTLFRHNDVTVTSKARHKYYGNDKVTLTNIKNN